MLKRKTTFVLGAGAHAPYGLPVGSDLLKLIVSALPTATHRSDFMDRRFSEVHPGLTSDHITAARDLRSMLNNTGHLSIDKFLSTHRDRPYFVEIGKSAISWCLLPKEFQHSWDQNRPDRDWLSYLFGVMMDGVNSLSDFFEKNNASFITFNYDRTLEHFFVTKLSATFGLNPLESRDAINSLNIIHVYGQLGGEDAGYSRVNVADLRGQSLKSSASSIQLLFEAPDSMQVDRAKGVLADAQVITFLGYGFHAENNTLLDLDKLCCNPQKQVIASRYLLTDYEWTRARTRMPSVRFFSELNDTHDCLATLRYSPSLEC